MKQAAYIAGCLANGQSKVQIATAFAGDMQLVNMWMLFLKHNGWMGEPLNDRWPVSVKGKAWIAKVAAAR